MKKIAIAAICILTNYVVYAQSSVTFYGVVDAAVSRTSNRSNLNTANGTHFSKSANRSRTELRPSGYSSSRIGFRGTEDLGGGWAAGFVIESPLNNDDGTNVLTFSRRSTLSLMGPMGEIRLGRDYTPTFWNDSHFHPFATNGVGASLLATANNTNFSGAAGAFGGNPKYARASNSVGYFLPTSLTGFYGQAMYSFHEATQGTGSNVSSPQAEKYVGARLGYEAGPINIAASYGDSASTDTTVKLWNVGGTYDVGSFKLFGEISYAKSDLKSPPSPKVVEENLNGYTFGITVPIGVGVIRAAYARVKYGRAVVSNGDPVASQVSLGYIHNLSKRTSLYANLGHIKNKNGSGLAVGGPAFFDTTGAPGGRYIPARSQGYEVGIRHTF